MSYFSAVVAREAGDWSATLVSLADVADLTEVVERLRDAAPTGEVIVLFVEDEDDYLVIARLDADSDDLRVFGNDAAFADESRLGALLLTDAAAVPAAHAHTAPGDAAPVGDPELLADLGVPSAFLLGLCAREGMLPADITAEVGQAMGCGDEVEELREA